MTQARPVWRFSWVLGRPAVSSVIIAARKIEQLEDNIRAVDLQLSDDEVQLLDAASIRVFRIPKWDGPSARHRGRSASKSCIRNAMRMAAPGRTSAGPGDPAEMALLPWRIALNGNNDVKSQSDS